MAGRLRRLRWRRIKPRLPPSRLVDAAAEEARLIAASGGLALRHAAEMAQEGGDAADRARRAHERRRDAVSYITAIVTTAMVLAVILLFVLPHGLPLPPT
ncbi:hypothetical protein [Vineibacter terrae]|uniref:hypothetical protein n=1 Tax=Vineibacter terrae TaxID=2586908 RepID=UPI002E34065A|nr:hypothetical protein [Vineibacter terrae]HEX2887390.1 hypothetical protein [Vineibacter terrae]